MVRTDEEDGVTMISHDEGIDRWLVTRKELTDASHVSITCDSIDQYSSHVIITV